MYAKMSSWLSGTSGQANTDQGRCLESHFFQEFCHLLEIKKVKIDQVNQYQTGQEHRPGDGHLIEGEDGESERLYI